MAKTAGGKNNTAKRKKEKCTQCTREIKTQIFKGTGVCCEQCRKDRDNDHQPFIPVNMKP